jgi:hypothetical protein
MTTFIWFLAMLLSGLFLITIVPVLFYFNPIAGAVFGFIFLRLFLLSISVFKDHRNAEKWANEAAYSPILNNDPNNIVSLPAHHLHDQFQRVKN